MADNTFREIGKRNSIVFPNRWTHVVLVYDSDNLGIYQDGVPEMATFTPTEPLVWCVMINTLSKFNFLIVFKGMILDFRLVVVILLLKKIARESFLLKSLLLVLDFNKNTMASIAKNKNKTLPTTIITIEIRNKFYF